jgi:predicted DNA-binding protein
VGVVTHATPQEEPRRDTLTNVVQRSGRGTARQSVRVPEPLWERFGQLAQAEGKDRSAIVREFIQRYIEEHGDQQGPPEPNRSGE